MSSRRESVVFRQGDPAGPLRRRGGTAPRLRRGGRRAAPLSYLRKGDFFGEISVFKGGPRTATVEAVSPCRLLALPAKAFQKAAAEHPALRAAIEKQIEQYDYRKVARVPLDFAEELLPADAQVRDVEPGPGGPGGGRGGGGERPRGALRHRGRTVRQAREADPPIPPREADRRDGLRGRVHGDDLPLLRAGRQPLAASVSSSSRPPTGRACGPSAGAPGSSGSPRAR